jgi:tetratricopeptide (TPR) repeat protein
VVSTLAPERAATAPGSQDSRSDYAVELERIDERITAHRDGALRRPTDTEQVTTYVNALYQRALLCGDLAALEQAAPAIEAGIALIAHPGDLFLLKARLAFHLHRLSDAQRILDTVAPARDSPEGQALRADLDVQHGRYAAAMARYEAVVERYGNWGALAGLAYLHGKMGDCARADRLYAQAEDELTAKEMRSFAWLELQRGVLDLAHGRHDEAAAHYARAGRAYSGWWLIDEHVAELTAARGDVADAAALYESVVVRAPRPELQQALGQLYVLMERRGRARSCFVQARAGYLASVRSGGVHYYHHLADFYAEAVPDGRRAVDWARRDLALRENFNTQATLAWALMRNGSVDEALTWTDRALACGVKDAHLLAQAAAVYGAAGKAEQAARCLDLARAINPRLGRFHVHR